MQRGCNILISYMVLDSENAISRASFVQVPSYRSARRQMNHKAKFQAIFLDRC